MRAGMGVGVLETLSLPFPGLQPAWRKMKSGAKDMRQDPWVGEVVSRAAADLGKTARLPQSWGHVGSLAIRVDPEVARTGARAVTGPHLAGWVGVLLGGHLSKEARKGQASGWSSPVAPPHAPNAPTRLCPCPGRSWPAPPSMACPNIGHLAWAAPGQTPASPSCGSGHPRFSQVLP